MSCGALRKHSQMIDLGYLITQKKNLQPLHTPFMAYGAETWRLAKQLESKHMSDEWPMERMMLGVALWERKRAT